MEKYIQIYNNLIEFIELSEYKLNFKLKKINKIKDYFENEILIEFKNDNNL